MVFIIIYSNSYGQKIGLCVKKIELLNCNLIAVVSLDDNLPP